MHRSGPATLSARPPRREPRARWWSWLRVRRVHRCRDLVPFARLRPLLEGAPDDPDDDGERAARVGYRPEGVREVPLERIVGSFGRAAEFDLRFRPRRGRSERWWRTWRLRALARALPPVVVYRVGEALFVEDGNHRVSVARARGEEAIRARVIAVEGVELAREVRCTRLGFRLPPQGESKSNSSHNSGGVPGGASRSPG